MPLEVAEWHNLFLRWAHVVAGILWIGQTWLFLWMEKAFEPPKTTKDPNIAGELWMVHGGGFYLVQKQKWPELMPRRLHWFKWEAAMTWLTGVALLAVVYWAGSPLLPYGSETSRGAAVGLSAGSLVAAWAGYLAIWRGPLGRHPLVGAALSWLAIVGSAWGLGQVLSDRAAYLHVGAMLGTIMVSNVWMVIIPNQRKMMALTEKGAPPKPELAAASKRASSHNSYMGVPLIFLMLSSHFPTTFGREQGTLILGALVLAGWGAAHLMRKHL